MNDLESVSEEETTKSYEWKKIFKFISEYYTKTDEKLVAWLLLLGIALCVIGMVALIPNESRMMLKNLLI